MTLARLRSALAAYDAATTYDATVRTLSGLAGAAQEVCAALPPDAPTLPQDAPVAAAPAVAPVEAGELDGEARAGAAEVSNELALAAAGHASSALDVDDLPKDDDLALVQQALAEPDPRHAVFTWDLVVRAFVAGAKWRARTVRT